MAEIVSITPRNVLEGKNTTLQGTGYFFSGAARFVWSSSEDGVLYNGTDPTLSLNNLSYGIHSVFLRVQGKDGSWSNKVSELISVHKRPVASITSIIPNPALTTDEPILKGTGMDDGFIRTYSWKLDSAEVSNGSADSIVLTDLSVGTYSISLKIEDNHGVWSEEVSTSLVIHTRPSAEIEEVEPNPALTTDIIKIKAKAEDDGEVVRYLWRTNSGELCNGSEEESTLQDLPAGTYTLFLKVQDNAGAWSEEVSTTLTVHTRPTATITSISPSPPTVGEVVTFSGQGTDDGTVVRYLWTSSIDGELHNDTKASFSTANLSIGTHTIILKVQDEFGVWSEEASTSLVVNPKENILPEVTITSPKNGTELKGTVKIKGSASDEDDEVEKIDILVDGEWFTATGSTSWEFELDTTKLDNGEYVLKVLAFDGEDYSNDTLLYFTVNNEKKDNDDGGFLPGFELAGIVFACMGAFFWWHRKK